MVPYIVAILAVVLILSWSPFPDWFFSLPFLGRRNFRPYEQEAFDLWKSGLEKQELEILVAQFKQLRLIQRGAGDARIACFFHNAKDLLLFKNNAPDLHVATVEFEPNGTGNTNPIYAKIYLHCGRFYSIEFPKRPKRLTQQRGIKIEDLKATRIVYSVSPSFQAS